MYKWSMSQDQDSCHIHVLSSYIETQRSMKPGMQHQGIKLGKVYINDVCVDHDLFKKQGQIWSPMGYLQQITIIMTNLCLFEKKCFI